MRTTLKLIFALVFVLSLQFSIYGYFAYGRLNSFFRRDAKEDGFQIGRTLAKSFRQEWEARGRKAGLAFLTAVNDQTPDYAIRFVLLTSSPPAEFRPELSLPPIAEMTEIKQFTRYVYADENSNYVYTYVRVPFPEEPGAAIEIRQSFEPEANFTRVSMVRIGFFLLLIIAVTGSVMLLCGAIFIARPLRRLQERTQQIGRGEFSTALPVNGSDEISKLSDSINQMSEKLQQTKTLLETESAARIAAAEQLRHADRLTTIGTLASGVAHELATPLNIASGTLESLCSALGDDEEKQNSCAMISQQMNKMAGIIAQLLNFSRRRTPEKTWVNLEKLAGRVVKMLSPFAGKRGVRIEMAPAEIAMEGAVDESQFEQVFTNILLNAIQAMDAGSIFILFSASEISNPRLPDFPPRRHLSICISDTGGGIDGKSVSQIFDPFFTTKAPGHGTGMGLSIAHDIVTEHGGWIEVESQVGTGSAFTVYVPVESI